MGKWNSFFLLFDDLHAAFNELVLEHRDLVIQSEVNACVYLEQHVHDALSHFLLLAIDGDLPENSDSFHLIRSHFGAHLNQVRVEFTLAVVVSNEAGGCICNIIILGNKLVRSQVHQDEEALDAVVALQLKVCK